MYFPFLYDQENKHGTISLSKQGTAQNLGYRFSATSNNAINLTGAEGSGIRFVSYWCKFDVLPSNVYTKAVVTDRAYMNFMPTDSNSSHVRNVIYIMNNGQDSPYNNNWYYSGIKSITLTNWNHYAYGIDSSNNYYWMLNGVVQWSGKGSGTQYHGLNYGRELLSGSSITATFLDVIGEDILWTQADTLEYYKKSKAFYGL